MLRSRPPFPCRISDGLRVRGFAACGLIAFTQNKAGHGTAAGLRLFSPKDLFYAWGPRPPPTPCCRHFAFPSIRSKPRALQTSCRPRDPIGRPHRETPALARKICKRSSGTLQPLAATCSPARSLCPLPLHQPTLGFVVIPMRPLRGSHWLPPGGSSALFRCGRGASRAVEGGAKGKAHEGSRIPAGRRPRPLSATLLTVCVPVACHWLEGLRKERTDWLETREGAGASGRF